MNIILIGFKGCGKTSVGAHLAQLTQRCFIDTDRWMEQHYRVIYQESQTVREIYRSRGESFFRLLEKSVLTSLQDTQTSIIATGGGAVLDCDNVMRLRHLGCLIYLHVSRETFAARLNMEDLPVFLDPRDSQSVSLLYEQREMLYQQAAHKVMFTENKSIAALAIELMTWMDNQNGF
ncbi:MAG: hypothetical protein CK424_06045 [Legionella sp.]|nr:MAG: hypothetical protein CK424_06045 [Legionella sp.]